MTLRDLLDQPGPSGARWSVALRGSDGWADEVGADLRLPTASVGKLFLLVEVAAALEDGRLAEDVLVPRDRVEPVHDSGLWQHLSVPALPVTDLAVLVGAASDNWATNALLDLVGLPAVVRRAEELAPGGSRLLDRVRDVRTSEDPVTLSLGCARDHVELLLRLRAGDVVSPAVSRRVLAWLAPALDLSMVSAAFGLDPLAHLDADRGWRVWSKTGTDDGVRAEVGLASGPGGEVAFAVLAHWDTRAPDRRDVVLGAMREVGRLLRNRYGAAPA